MIEKGVVKWFNHDRGYGFIIPDTGGEDVRVLAKILDHEPITKYRLRTGAAVTFTRITGRSEALTVEILGTCPACGGRLS